MSFCNLKTPRFMKSINSRLSLAITSRWQLRLIASCLITMVSCNSLREINDFERRLSSSTLTADLEEPITVLAGERSALLCNASIQQAVREVLPSALNKSEPHLSIRIETLSAEGGYILSVLSGATLFTLNLLGMPIGIERFLLSMQIDLIDKNGSVVSSAVVEKSFNRKVGLYSSGGPKAHDICAYLTRLCLSEFADKSLPSFLNITRKLESASDTVSQEVVASESTGVQLVERVEPIASDNIRIRISDETLASYGISKVAVIGKESVLCDGRVDSGLSLAELVEGELVGIYGVVERKHLQDILDEQRLALGGLIFEESDYARAGCLAGAQGTVLASFGCLRDRPKVTVKLVNCSTSDVLWSATGIDVDEFDLLDELRLQLERQ